MWVCLLEIFLVANPAIALSSAPLRLIAVGYTKWYAKWYAILSRKKNIAYRIEYCLARAVEILYMVRQIHSNWAIGEDSPLSEGLGGHLSNLS